MTTPKIDELLDVLARQSPPETGYPPARKFIATFRQQLQRRRRRTLLRLYWGATAAALLILLAWPWSAPAQPDDFPAGTTDCTAPSERLAAAERHFGPAAGIIFVNDDLLVFERQDEDRANNYLVTIELLSPNGEKLARLEFATAGDDYIILDDEMIRGRIFLIRGDNQDAVLEMTLRLQDPRQEKIHLDEIMALERLSTTRPLDNGTRLRVDFCRRES